VWIEAQAACGRWQPKPGRWRLGQQDARAGLGSQLHRATGKCARLGRRSPSPSGPGPPEPRSRKREKGEERRKTRSSSPPLSLRPSGVRPLSQAARELGEGEECGRRRWRSGEPPVPPLGATRGLVLLKRTSYLNVHPQTIGFRLPIMNIKKSKKISLYLHIQFGFRSDAEVIHTTLILAEGGGLVEMRLVPAQVRQLPVHPLPETLILSSICFAVRTNG
jgi:hypothetical protein